MRLRRYDDHLPDTDPNHWHVQLPAVASPVVIHAPRAAEVAEGDVTTVAPAVPTQPAAAA